MIEIEKVTLPDKTVWIHECDCGYNFVTEEELNGCIKCPYCGSKSCE
jgi:hypothetical protein